MKFFCILLASLSSLFLTSCSRYYLSVDKQIRNRDFLASTYVGSPDPTPTECITGEQIVVAWHMPRSYVNKATCELELTYWDYTQDMIEFTIKERLGQYCLENLGQNFEKNKGVISYKAVIKDPEGKITQVWEHQLYTKIIHVSEDEIEINEDAVETDDDPWDWETSL
jgi:hypothetical protein